MTMKELFSRALQARGERRIKQTFRYDVWSRRATGLHYYVGRSGALRVGATVQSSVPVKESFKAMLLEEGKAVQS